VKFPEDVIKAVRKTIQLRFRDLALSKS
jgi:hypothetical protein